VINTLPTLLTGVHRPPPPFVTCADMMPLAAGERFNGTRYTQAQLNTDWQSFGYQTFHNAVKTVLWPQTHNHHNSTGVSWDNMPVPDWMTAHLSGGTTSEFGRLMLADVTAEYGILALARLI